MWPMRQKRGIWVVVVNEVKVAGSVAVVSVMKVTGLVVLCQ